jgi:hypothetical protein
MIVRDCHLRRAMRLARTFAAALCCYGVLAVQLSAGQADSGWAVSHQQAFTVNSLPADPIQKIILHQVLQRMDSPLLHETANEPAAATTAQGSVRFAVRPDGVDGWRPAEQTASPLHEHWRADLRAPQLNAPGVAHPTVEIILRDDEPAGEQVEADCGDRQTETVDQAPDEPSELDGSDKSADSASIEDGSDGWSTAPADEESDPPAEDQAEETPDDEVEQSVEKELDTRAQPDVGPITDESTAEPVKKPTPPPPLTKQLMSLRSRVRGVLKGYYRRQLNSREHDPWEVMHGMLAYGVHSRIRQGGSRGTPVTSVGWLCYNKPCKNQTLMYVTPKGELRAKYGVGLQGHLGQLLAMLAQCRVSEEYPIRVGKREFTIKDLIEAEQKTCYPKSELTFKLLAFQYYLDLDDTWVNDQGVEWDFSRLIREELAQPIRGAACGGTHRLSSLSLTVKARQRRGEPLDGEYARAAEFVQKYHRYAFGLQNRDGSLSTEWFRGRGDDRDINRRIKTTGHILEWLCYSLSDEELRQPKTIAAVSYLANLMSKEYDNEWEVGPMSHATHALLIYDERVFQPFDNANYTAIYKPKSRSASATAKRIEWKTAR